MAEGMYMITTSDALPLSVVTSLPFLEEDGFTLIDTGPNMAGVLPALEACLAEIDRRVEDCRQS